MLLGKILVAGAVVAFSAGAFAQGPSSMSTPSMKSGSMNHGMGSMNHSMGSVGAKTMKMGSHHMGLNSSHSIGSNTNVHEATPTPKSPLPPFKQADTNHDGAIEWSEAKADHVPKRIFKKEDYEHNGKLDRTEWMLVGYDMEQAKAKKQASTG